MQHQRTYTEEEKQMQAAIKASLAKSVALGVRLIDQFLDIPHI